MFGDLRTVLEKCWRCIVLMMEVVVLSDHHNRAFCGSKSTNLQVFWPKLIILFVLGGQRAGTVLSGKTSQSCIVAQSELTAQVHTAFTCPEPHWCLVFGSSTQALCLTIVI